ncbi:MAG TPA: DUF4440 domain-containing protein, partial [Gemmatimonadota bacterium]|nr:DUF4440 domain-containing protein [Gemmatimonadota bacterium]
MRGRQPIVFAAALAAAACGPENFGDAREMGAEEAPVGAAEREEARLELIGADRAFARATADRGIDGWVEWFDAEGAMIQDGGEIVGPTAIREAMGPVLSDTAIALRWTPERAEVSGDGGLGFTVGPYEVVSINPAPGTEAVQSRGTYLTVWKRQPDSSWKVLADIGSPA